MFVCDSVGSMQSAFLLDIVQMDDVTPINYPSEASNWAVCLQN